MPPTQITLRTAVVLPFVIIFLFTIGVIFAVQNNSYEDMVQDTSRKQLSSLTSNVTLELQQFLNIPFNASLILSHGISFNELYQDGDTSNVEQYLLSNFKDIYLNIPRLDAIGFGGEGGDFVAYRKESDDDYTLILQDERTDDELIVYQGSEISENVRSVFQDYDPRIRPWYAPVAESLKPGWSEIYTNADEKQEITLSALAPVFYQRDFIGVVVTDVKIDTFNAFLMQKQREFNTIIYVFDGEQRLIAQSDESGVVSGGTPDTPAGKRLLTTESANPIIKASALFAETHQLPLETSSTRFSLEVDNERYFYQITPYNDEFGLEWYIGVATSEEALLGKLPKSQRDSWIIGLILCTLGIFLGLFSFNRIVAPITSTAAAARHLAKGDWDSKMPKPGNIYETSMLVFAFTEMTNNLKASFRAMRHQLLYDSLTELYSRHGLTEVCDRRGEYNGCLMLIGLNKFREINDSLGQAKGDQLLVAIADKLKVMFDVDCYIARVGGDEFAVYLIDNPNDAIIADNANRLTQLFSSPFIIQKERILVSASIGIVADHVERNMTMWLRSGSIALSKAKRDRTSISYYKPEMADYSRKRTKMLAKIKDGIERNEFVPFYQPIVDLHTGKVVGAEALARWLSPDSGIIEPKEFIAIAEESGLIEKLGEQILYQACFDAVKGIKEGKWCADFHLHVNLSVNQLVQPNFIDVLKNVLKKTGLNPDNLTLEVTESRIVDDDPITIGNMQKIIGLGVHIAIDDFGTGYSSLSYLSKLPFDCLKIDRAFVEMLDRETIDTSIVAVIINMTKSLKIELVAEGVETPEQANMLSELSAETYGQGFLFSKAVAYEKWPTKMTCE
ncbi:EAL domain-containing protein [Grimontia sp. S25]|uniref:EAL domain-containing protein n=1 Tax=Grimontia sedimenti TaxID=2711294 RepID=A0A6M1RCD4_9GAMM|nr:GGDEF and EAL domain-containing protein [Grimontia sedimenti]NGN97102.1 EAL domain-containing protein [Grimontia sedimenti]